jgi:hypothetical protein
VVSKVKIVGLIDGRISRIFTGLIRILNVGIRINPVKIREIRISINPMLIFVDLDFYQHRPNGNTRRRTNQQNTIAFLNPPRLNAQTKG